MLAGELVEALFEGARDTDNDERRLRYRAGARLVANALTRIIRGGG